MRFSCKTEDFGAVLQSAVRVVNRRALNPTLAGVLVEAAGGQLQITGTDLEARIELSLPAEIEQDGAAVINAQRLTAAARALSGETASFNREHSSAVLDDGTTRFKLPAMDADDFPLLPEVLGPTIRLPQRTLRDMLVRTLFATHDSDERPQLGGVLFEVDAAVLRLHATDMFRGSIVTAELSETHETKTALVPARYLSELERFLGDDGETEIILGANLAAFRVPGCFLATRLIEQTFPGLARIIRDLPAYPPIKIRADRQRLIEAIQRVSAIEGRTARVVLTAQGGQLLVQTHDPERGEAREAMAAETRGERYSLAFPAQQMIQFLHSTQAEQVTIGATDDGRPVRWKAEGEDWYQHVIMPVQIGEQLRKSA